MTNDGKNRSEATGWGSYYKWLISIIEPPKGESRTGCGKIVRQLFSIKFTYYILNDVNRMKHGLDLRRRYLWENQEASLPDDGRPCSVLEVLIGLSVCIADDISGYYENPEIARFWFWKFFDNLRLNRYSGGKYDKEVVSTVIENWLRRDFKPNGIGSPFPLKHPKGDQ